MGEVRLFIFFFYKIFDVDSIHMFMCVCVCVQSCWRLRELIPESGRSTGEVPQGNGQGESTC